METVHTGRQVLNILFYSHFVYFQLAEKVADFTKTIVVSDAKRLRRYVESPLHKRDAFLTSESGDLGIHEIVMDQRRVKDVKPVHASICILQHSKLMLLQFVDFLRNYLEKGSYAIVYGGNMNVI